MTSAYIITAEMSGTEADAEAMHTALAAVAFDPPFEHMDAAISSVRERDCPECDGPWLCGEHADDARGQQYFEMERDRKAE